MKMIALDTGIAIAPIATEIATRIDSLKEQYEALSQLRQHVLSQGEIINRKPEIFATVKKNGRVCGNVQSETGAKGYAFLTTVKGGRKKRLAIPPSKLGYYEAAYARGVEVRRIDRELKKLSRQIDRQSGVTTAKSRPPKKLTGKKSAGQIDMYCTRDDDSKEVSEAGFSFVVFRWQSRPSDGKLKRSKALKRFPVMPQSTPEQVEAVRKRAIAFMDSLR